MGLVDAHRLPEDVEKMNGHTPSLFHGPNSGALFRVALICAVAVFVASLVPAELTLATLRAMLNWAALFMGFTAILRRVPLKADHLTRWDEALFLLAASLLTGAFVDPAAVSAFLAEAQAPEAAAFSG